jgi:hypothetical protein
MQVVRTLREGILVQESATVPLAFRVSVPVGKQLLIESGPAQAAYKSYMYVQIEALPEDLRNRIDSFLQSNRF